MNYTVFKNDSLCLRASIGVRGEARKEHIMLRILRYIVWAILAALSVAVASVLLDERSNEETVGIATQGSGIGAPFQLIDHDGAPISEKAMEGHPAIVFFGFTHCPEVCPTTLHNLTVWLNQLGADGRRLRVFFISVDPTRDTPQMLQAYIHKFTNRITGVTGDPGDIDKLTKSWHVFTKRVPLEDGDYTMDHTASIFLLREDGILQGTIKYGDDATVALQKLRLLLSS